MIPIPSKIEGLSTQLYQLEEQLKPLGYSIGGNWDYDHGYFDYKMNDEGSYEVLRIPFVAVDGQLDSQGVTVQLGRPFLLSHQYQDGVDTDIKTDMDPLSATIDQFQEPVNKDAKFPDKYKDVGIELVIELEAVILEENG